MDPATYDYRVRPAVVDVMKGLLAESWEWTDPYTLVFHLRQGIRWQNIAPVNGREFTANDVVLHNQRLYGLGSTFKSSPYQSKRNLVSVTAQDKYTAVYKWSVASPEYQIENMTSFATGQCFEAPEAVALWGDVNDWHRAIGTGPFILTDFVAGASATLTKNPNYWQNDERYPQNKIPYLDSIKALIIPDDSTAQAALRTGKIDALEALTYQTSLSIKKTNPELIQAALPGSSNNSLSLRCDTAPFKDVRVRIALQKAINLPSIAKDYYFGLTSAEPASMTGNMVKGGWAFPYSDWPQDLKDEYSYDVAAAKKLLADAGLPNGFKTNLVASTAADMDLMQVVKSYFSAIGVDMEIRPMDPTAWTNFVWTAKKHDQIVTRGGGELGQISEPLSQWTFLTNNTGGNAELINDPYYEAAYTKATTATDIATTKATVQDINRYVAKQHWAVCLLVENTYTAYAPWFKGYYGQFDAIACGAVGPHLLGFYCARFWIDQNMKKSMGH